MKEMIQPPAGASPAATNAAEISTPPPSAGIDLVKIKQYLHIIVRRIWIVAICFTVAMVISIINISKQESVFRATAILLMTRGTPLPSQLRTPEATMYGDFIDTQLRIINSRTTVSRARQFLNMPEQEVNRLLRSVRAGTVGRSAMVGITVESLDAQFSSDFANAVANAYLEFKEEERTALSQTTVVNMTQQANKIREELRKAEDTLILFKKENPSVIASRGGNMAAGMMADVSQRAAMHRLERMILEVQRPLLAEASDDIVLMALGSRYMPFTPAAAPSLAGSRALSASEGEDASIVVSTGAEVTGTIDILTAANLEWLNVKRRKSSLEHELRLARENLRDNHPSIRKLLVELNRAQSAIEREVQFATEKYFAELEALSLKETSLRRVESLWMEEAIDAELVLDRYHSLYNDVSRLKKLLEVVFNRIREVDISAGVVPDNVSIMEEAVRRNVPITPRKIQSVFVASMIGMAVGLGIIFGLEFLDDSIRYPEDVSRAIGLKFLGIVPAANWSATDIRSHLLSNLDPKSGLAEAYRNIRAAILTDEHSRSARTILITSSVPREGKTTTSINLAISLAQAGQRVLIVDADMRRGEVHKYFGLEGGRGFSDVLGGTAKPEAVIQRTGVPNLDMVATGPFPATPAELILRNEFRAFVDFARRSYDKIIFDGPPVMAVSEATVLSGLVESTIMVVWAGNTSRKVCQLTAQNLRQRGARIDGCILNNLEFGRVGYYYYSTYYGYYTYDYRYDDDTSRKT